MELRDAAVPRARQCVRRRTTRSFGSRHVLSERPRERATDTREKLMSIVAIRRVAVVAFAVVCATSLASEARAQSTPPRQETLPQTREILSFLGRGARAHLGEPQQWPPRISRSLERMRLVEEGRAGRSRRQRQFVDRDHLQGQALVRGRSAFLTLRADEAPPTPPWSPAESRYCARTPRNSASRQSRTRSRRRERRFARACETRGSSP